MATKKIAGTCYFKVNGEQLELTGNLKFPLSNVTRETKLSTSGVAGYSETVTAPYIEGDFLIPADFPLAEIKDNTSLTITAECANGWVYTLSEAYLVGDAVFSPIDGTMSLKFEGTNGELG